LKKCAKKERSINIEKGGLPADPVTLGGRNLAKKFGKQQARERNFLSSRHTIPVRMKKKNPCVRK